MTIQCARQVGRRTDAGAVDIAEEQLAADLEGQAAVLVDEVEDGEHLVAGHREHPVRTPLEVFPGAGQLQAEGGDLVGGHGRSGGGSVAEIHFQEMVAELALQRTLEHAHGLPEDGIVDGPDHLPRAHLAEVAAALAGRAGRVLLRQRGEVLALARRCFSCVASASVLTRIWRAMATGMGLPFAVGRNAHSSPGSPRLQSRSSARSR